MPQTQKQLILESIQKMDINRLGLLLDDGNTYQEATKAVFLEKLNDVFERLKKSNDTHLLAEKGVCCSTHCDQRGCRGYSFVGNVSKKCIDLIFEESEDDVNNICNCKSFRTDDELRAEVREYTGIDDDESRRPIYIDIKLDEKADFRPNDVFLRRRQQFRSAYEELAQYQDMVIGKDIYLAWLHKYREIYKVMSIYSPSYIDSDKFYWLYYRLEELAAFLPHEKSTKQGLADFRNVDENEEIQLLKWLSQYEKLGYDLVMFLYEEEMGREEFFDKKEYFTVDILKINTADFKHIIAFKNLFDKYYWDKLKQYQTIQLQDMKALERQNLQSLREQHIRDSRKWYKNYREEYPKYPRPEPLLTTEEAFVAFLNTCDNFYSEYLREYCHEEAERHMEWNSELMGNQQSLTYQLRQRGIK